MAEALHMHTLSLQHEMELVLVEHCIVIGETLHLLILIVTVLPKPTIAIPTTPVYIHFATP